MSFDHLWCFPCFELKRTDSKSNLRRVRARFIMGQVRRG
jgi:hypothetical protein